MKSVLCKILCTALLLNSFLVAEIISVVFIRAQLIMIDKLRTLLFFPHLNALISCKKERACIQVFSCRIIKLLTGDTV